MKQFHSEQAGSMTVQDFEKILSLLREAQAVMPAASPIEAPKLSALYTRLGNLRIEFANHALKLGLKVEI